MAGQPIHTERRHEGDNRISGPEQPEMARSRSGAKITEKLDPVLKLADMAAALFVDKGVPFETAEGKVH